MRLTPRGRRAVVPSLAVAALLSFSAFLVLGNVPAARATTPGPILYPVCGTSTTYPFGSSPSTTPASCSVETPFEALVNLDGVNQGDILTSIFVASSDTTTTFSPTAIVLTVNTANGPVNYQVDLGSIKFSQGTGGISCSEPYEIEVALNAGGTGTFPETTSISLALTGFSSAVQFCTGYQFWAPFVDFSEPTTQTAVSCFPYEIAAYSAATCTATVSGQGSPTGTVDFSSSTSTGSFSPPDGTCTLSDGSCSVQYTDNPNALATIYATYNGDSTNVASSGLSNVQVAPAAGGTSTVTVTSTETTTTTSAAVTTTVVAPVTSTTTTTTVSGTTTTTATTTVATEGSLETTILDNQGTFNPGDTIASLLYGLGAAVSNVMSAVTALTSSVNFNFSVVTAYLTGIQTTVNGLTTTVTNGFASITTTLTSMQTSLSSITSTLNSIQSSINTLSTAQSHSALTGSASGETALTSSSPTFTIYTTSNNKVAMMAVSVNATQTSGHGFQQSGPLQIRFYTDPSHPNVYVQQTVSIYDFGVGNGNLGDGYVGTGAAWKIVLVGSFPAHNSDATITANWAVSSSGPP